MCHECREDHSERKGKNDGYFPESHGLQFTENLFGRFSVYIYNLSKHFQLSPRMLKDRPFGRIYALTLGFHLLPQSARVAALFF